MTPALPGLLAAACMLAACQHVAATPPPPPAGSEEALTAPGPLGPLAGTLRRPAPGAPLVLILPGSGPTDRDGNNPLGVAAAPYRYLADALAAGGVGSLRIDKRGLGGSAGAVADGNAVTVADYVTDTTRWIAAARALTGAKCVWLAGHSEGGLVALAAAGEDGVCGLVLLEAPGRPLGTLMREQLAANPANAPLMADALAALAKLEQGERVDVSGFHPALQRLFAPQVQGFLIDMLGRDPAALARASTLPLLIVSGGRDLQVAPADAEALAAARPDAERLTLPAMNHVLKDVPADPAANMQAYADPALPLADGLSSAIIRFVTAAPLHKN